MSPTKPSSPVTRQQLRALTALESAMGHRGGGGAGRGRGQQVPPHDAYDPRKLPAFSALVSLLYIHEAAVQGGGIEGPYAMVHHTSAVPV